MDWISKPCCFRAKIAVLLQGLGEKLALQAARFALL